MNPRLRSVLVRGVVPALLAALCALVVARGGDALPAFLANAAMRTGLGLETMCRLMVALMASGALWALCFGRIAPAVAWITLVGVAFVSLAELSSVFAGPGKGTVPASTWMVPLGGIALGVAGVWCLNATASRAAQDRAASPGRIGAWHVLLGLGAAGVSFAVAAQLTVAPRTTLSQGGVEYVDLDVTNWVGRTLPATGLPRFVPMVTPATLEGTKWIVFYQPSCGRCHEVFEVFFEGDQQGSVVAIEVPHAPDATVLESDQPSEIECVNCVRLALPAGKHYMVTTPSIVKVEDGVVTCVTTHDYGRCRQPSELAKTQ